MTKICLINPPTTPYFSKDIYFPMGLISLGTSLEEEGIESEIIDFDLDLKKDPSLSNWETFKRHALQRLDHTECDVFGISSICSNFPFALLLANEIKMKWPNSKVILGGPQPSSVPEETLRVCPWVDIIVIGEGENTLVELMKGDWDVTSLLNTSGIAFRNGKEIHKTSPRKLIDNLDHLPFPRFERIQIQDYLAIAPLIPLIEAGRGCPFLCSFCSTSLMWERQFRMKSPGRILEEMRRLQRDLGLNSFSLTHDNFTTSHRYVAEFSEHFEKNNSEKFSWSVSARPDTLNIERIHALYRGGCRGFFFGIDSGSAKTQADIQKHLNISHFKTILTESVSLGIESITSFIVGLPTETEEDLDQTIHAALESKLMGAVDTPLHRLSPLSGTSIEKEYRSELIWDKTPSDVSLSPFDDEEIDELIKSQPILFSSFYSVPTPNLNLNMPAFSVFYYEIINKMPSVLKALLNQTQLSPCDLFKRWDEWRSNYYQTRTIDNSLILNLLGEFIGSLSSPATVGIKKCSEEVLNVATV